MPPITSPRRTALHSPPAPLRPAPVPIPGAVPPLSSSASTFASTPPSAGTSPGSASLGSMGASLSMGRTHSHHSTTSHHAQPYMVALAGWPEPVFVAERETWDVRKRSRPTTPTGFRGEVRDGVGCPLPASLVNAAPTNGIVHPQPVKAHERTGSASNVHLTHHGDSHSLSLSGEGALAKSLPTFRSVGPSSVAESLRRSRPASPTGFPTSSARDAPIPTPNSEDATPTNPSSTASTPPSAPGGTRRDADHGPLAGPLARLALGDSAHAHAHSQSRPASNPTLAARTVRRHMEKFGFSDPRYFASAAVIGRGGRSLRVAPAWTSAASGSGTTPTTSGAHVHGATPYAPHERAAHDAKHHLGTTHQPVGAGRGRPLVAGGFPPVRIARAAPEVWPPPGVLTQVYPRDPDTLFFPRSTTQSSRQDGASSGSGGASPDHAGEVEPAHKAARTVATEAKREREGMTSESPGVAGVGEKQPEPSEGERKERNDVKKDESKAPIPVVKVDATDAPGGQGQETLHKPPSLRGVPMDVDQQEE